ncbi:hypothetical protein PLICRDRAFT_354427 [Plicaturopsis crispa FD-325 SS-3]|uniref:Uncharacterized protein n=1 Tax=Plicaturopsis crispa FD-325 SS-3 TaxID=944288 RepID=A0A0C9SRF2_PLICR|nr:hypothetical protein PLICRDRAFT_354427 [Plicaturopsis crispa FD-325 SS-3]
MKDWAPAGGGRRGGGRVKQRTTRGHVPQRVGVVGKAALQMHGRGARFGGRGENVPVENGRRATNTDAAHETRTALTAGEPSPANQHAPQPRGSIAALRYNDFLQKCENQQNASARTQQTRGGPNDSTHQCPQRTSSSRPTLGARRCSTKPPRPDRTAEGAFHRCCYHRSGSWDARLPCRAEAESEPTPLQEHSHADARHHATPFCEH